MRQSNDWLRRLERGIVRHIMLKPYRIRADTGVVSFTFDDVPQSAVRAGGPILAKHGAAATYYVAGGLTDRHELGSARHSRDDLRALIQEGHELGSHTFSHLPLQGLSPVRIRQEIEENDLFLRSLGGDVSPVSFSYPFGVCGLRAKAIAAKRFATARGTRPGLNRGLVDLAQLRAVRLYSRLMAPAQAAKVIEKAAEQKAWLIFYTHDVADEPSRVGCTPRLLEAAVAEAVASGCAVLAVRNALGAVAFARPRR